MNNSGPKIADTIPSLSIRNQRIQEEFQRWAKDFNDDRAFTNCLSELDILKAHFLLIDFFDESLKRGDRNAEGVGGIGPRNIELLSSAVSRQWTEFGGVRKYRDLFEISASLFYGLLMNHPFHDANKRTALLSILYVMLLNNRIPRVPHFKFEELTVRTAEHSLSLYHEYDTSFEDPEVMLLANRLKAMTREVDNRQYSITYHSLDTAIRKYGYKLDYPRKNYINICRVDDDQFLKQIGFPGWTSQIQRSALHTVLKSTGLTSENGIDSAVLFHGEPSLAELIGRFNFVLKRLANR